MSLPVGLSTVTVTANALRPDGSGLTGTITFRPPSTLVAAAYDVELAGPVEMRFTGDAVAKTATLVATDAAGVLPSGFTYSVEESWTDAPGRTYSISLPAANPTVSLADIAQVSEDAGDVPGISSFGTSLVSAATGAVARTALAVAPVQLGRPGSRMVPLGASIENLHSFVTSSSISFGWDWPSFAMYLSAGRLQLIQNQAIGGQTSQQMIDRFDTDVTPFAPNIVPLGCVENDIQAYGALGWTLAQMTAGFKSTMKQLVAKCRAIGAVPVLRTAMPHVSTGVHLPTGAYNSWVKEWAASEGIPLVDMWSVLVDPTTGLYRANLTADGVHPNEEGSFRLAQYWLQQMDGLLPPAAFPLPQDSTDTGQLLPTPNFLTNTSGVPTGWAASGANPSQGTFSRSMVADPLGYGFLHRHTHQGTNGQLSTLGQTFAVPLGGTANSGDVMEISGMFSTDGGIPATVTVSIIDANGANNISRIPVSLITHQLDHATYRMQFACSVPNLQRLQVFLASGTATGPNTGVVDFSYPVLRNRTLEGTYPL